MSFKGVYSYQAWITIDKVSHFDPSTSTILSTALTSLISGPASQF